VTDEQNNMLCALPLNDEIKSLVPALNEDSTPSPGGYPGSF